VQQGCIPEPVTRRHCAPTKRHVHRPGTARGAIHGWGAAVEAGSARTVIGWSRHGVADRLPGCVGQRDGPLPELRTVWGRHRRHPSW
jgi:hypothetical protein